MIESVQKHLNMIKHSNSKQKTRPQKNKTNCDWSLCTSLPV